MLLDLRTSSSVLNDVLDLVTHLRDNGTFSFGLLVCCIVFVLLTYIAWRSTDIPQDVPSAPAPPFVITIQNSSNGGGLRRQNLSDIRVISPATYTNFIGSYPFARVGRGLVRAQNSTSRATQPSTTGTGQGIQDNVSTRHVPSRQQQFQAGRSFIFGFLRHPFAVSRAWVPAPARLVLSLFPPNIFVAGRAIHRQLEQTRRHHHRQQTHGHRERPQSPTPDSPENQVGETGPGNPTQSDGLSRRNSPLLSFPNIEASSGSDQSVGEAVIQDSIQNQVNSENSDDHHLIAQMDSENENDQLRGSNVDGPTERILDGEDVNIDDSKTSETQTQESETSAINEQEPPSDSTSTSDSLPEVKFTLKFLNDTQIEVNTHSGEKIGDFKRRHFVRELSENKIVRLIFNGRVMDQDNRTLQECGIFDHCVVHCLVVTPQQTAGQPGSGSASSGFGGRNSNNRAGQRGPEPGMFFMSFVGIILMFMWFVCINFGNHLFTQSAVVSLSILTIMFVAGIFTFYAPFQQQNNNNVNANT